MLHYDKRSTLASPITMFGVEGYVESAQNAPMLSADELLTLLRERGVKNAQIERVLKLPSSRVSELFKGERQLKLHEYKKLVEEFKVEETAPPLSEPIARLMVLYAAERLGTEMLPEDPQVGELAQEFAALSRFAADPDVRPSLDAFQAFLHGLRLGRDRTSAA